LAEEMVLDRPDHLVIEAMRSKLRLLTVPELRTLAAHYKIADAIFLDRHSLLDERPRSWSTIRRPESAREAGPHGGFVSRPG
jgi:hypothetical protein